MVIIFSYSIRVNGLLMTTKPTYKAALELVNTKFHDRKDVEVLRNGAIVWTSKGAH